MNIEIKHSIAQIVALAARANNRTAEEEVNKVLDEHYFEVRWAPGVGSPHDGFRDSIRPSLAQELQSR